MARLGARKWAYSSTPPSLVTTRLQGQQHYWERLRDEWGGSWDDPWSGDKSGSSMAAVELEPPLLARVPWEPPLIFLAILRWERWAIALYISFRSPPPRYFLSGYATKTPHSTKPPSKLLREVKWSCFNGSGRFSTQFCATRNKTRGIVKGVGMDFRFALSWWRNCCSSEWINGPTSWPEM